MKTMKNSILLAAALGLTLGLGACSDDDVVKGGTAKVGDEVNFTVGLNKDSRTYYFDEDGKGKSWQLSWEYGKDKIRVFSNQGTSSNKSTEGYYADYTVDTYNNNVEPNTEAQLVHDAEAMKWGEGLMQTTDGREVEGYHHFYAAYPGGDDSKITCVKYQLWTEWSNEEKAVFRFPFNRDQTVTVEATATGSSTDAAGTTYKEYKAKPDTKAQYMLGSTDGYRGLTHSGMDFQMKPLMTTLDVVIQNKSNATKTASVMGLVVKAKLPQKMVDDQAFHYATYCAMSGGFNKQGSGLCDKDGTLFTSWTAADTVTTWETFNATVSGGNANNAVDLAPGESVTLTVFLPPVDYTAQKTPLRFMVTGMNTGSVNAYVKADIKGSEKKKTRVAVNPDNKENKWIEFVDDNTYVNQLSIPGSNDAISYLANDNVKTQDLSIIEQLNMGIRAFDIQIDNNDGDSYNLSNGTTKLSNKLTIYKKDSEGKPTGEFEQTDATTNNLLSGIIAPWLKAHPKEFVIISFKNNGTWADWAFVVKKGTFAGAIDNVGSEHMIAWRQNLTVGECRGKVVYIARKNGTNSVTDEILTNIGDYCGRMEDEYEACTSGYKSTTLFSGDKRDYTYSGPLYYFAGNSKEGKNYTSDTAKRLGYVQSMLKMAQSTETDTSHPWCITYVAGSAASDDSADGYQDNANRMHPAMYKWVQENANGPLGIVFMDYVGVRSKGKYPTMDGDLFPASIINNNYRTKLKGN